MMIKRSSRVSAVLFLLLISHAWVFGESLKITGYVRNYTGVLLEGDNDFSIIQNTLNLNFEDTGTRVAFKVNPYIYNNMNSDIETGLRQAYIDVFFNSIDIRVGKQQVIWGKSDGVFITDVVSPKDLREFLLPDFEEIRMGVTAVKINHYFGNKTLEFVWIPTFTPTLMPEEGSIWRPAGTVPPENGFDQSRLKVRKSLKNSELFLRFSSVSSAIDLEAVAGYMWDDDPTVHMVSGTDPLSIAPPSLTVMPEHHRLGLVGGSFSTTLGGFVLRGEGAYYFGKYFPLINPLSENGAVMKDYLHYMIGGDYTLWGVRMSAQFIRQTILDHEDHIQRDRTEDMMTLMATRDFFRETLFLELFTYIGINNGDALIRGKAKYKFTDAVEVLLGVNFFTGSEGMFGTYNRNDMLYAKVKYSF
ncbi:MAG: DUF1302 family protein [Candidatus Delongbacteria bacterium]